MIGIDSLISLGSEIIKRVWPDPAQQAEAQARLLQMQQRGELAQLAADTRLSLAQLDVNKTEAASGSLFVAGWRPFVGWVCASALAYSFVVYPILKFILAVVKPGIVLPILALDDLWPLMFGMLGLGGMRSWEKTKGVAR